MGVGCWLGPMGLDWHGPGDFVIVPGSLVPAGCPRGPVETPTH